MKAENLEKSEDLNKYKEVLTYYTRVFTMGKYFIKAVFYKDMSAISMNR